MKRVLCGLLVACLCLVAQGCKKGCPCKDGKCPCPAPDGGGYGLVDTQRLLSVQIQDGRVRVVYEDRAGRRHQMNITEAEFNARFARADG